MASSEAQAASSLARQALTPIGEAMGLDYYDAALAAPVTPEARAFEAMRACSSLLMAWTFNEDWLAEDRRGRRRAKANARRVRDSFSDATGRAALCYATVDYGAVMAETRRSAAQEQAGLDATVLREAADADHGAR